MRIVLVYSLEVIAGANLPVFDGKIVGRVNNSPLVQKYKIGMTGHAACDAFLGRLAGFVSTVHQAGEVTDISTREIADISDVDGESVFALQGFEVTSFELFQEIRTISQHGVEPSGFKREHKQEQGEEAKGQRVVLSL